MSLFKPWHGENDAEWQAPELDLGGGRVIVLDATDPFAVDDCPVDPGD